MRALVCTALLALALLGSVSTLARDARTQLQVGATVLESCELTPAGARAARCASVASTQWRDAALPRPDEARSVDAAPRITLVPPSRPDERALPARVLLIRF